MSDLIERLEVAAQWDDSPSSLIHEAIARIIESDEVIKRLTGKIDGQTSAGYCDAQYISDGPPYRCGWQQRAEGAERQVQSLTQTLKAALQLFARCHSRIHCLPRTTDTELAEQIDNMLGRIREAIR